MEVNTTRFGKIDVNDDYVFKFLKPIIGYEDENEFVIIEHAHNSAFKWLQSVKTPELAFALTMAAYFGIDYCFELSDDVQELLGISSSEDIDVFNIAVIPHSNPRSSTINMLAPVIFNRKNKLAAQIILSGSNFEVSYPLFKQDENAKLKSEDKVKC